MSNSRCHRDKVRKKRLRRRQVSWQQIQPIRTSWGDYYKWDGGVVITSMDLEAWRAFIRKHVGQLPVGLLYAHPRG